MDSVTTQNSLFRDKMSPGEFHGFENDLNLLFMALEWMVRPFPWYDTLLSWKSEGAKMAGWNCLCCVVLQHHADPNCSNSCIINNPRTTDAVWGCQLGGSLGGCRRSL